MKEQFIFTGEGHVFYYEDRDMKTLHREDGPAIELPDGYKEWRIEGKRHREDGPAVEYAYGTKEWWLNGKELSEEEFNERMKQQ